jgi:glyoxylase I family protein
MLLGFEHVGFYCDLLGLKLVLRKHHARGEVAFLDTGSGMLEVFAPNADVARSRDVPPHEAGIRHMTLAYYDVDAIIGTLEAAGVEVVERPRDAINQQVLKRLAFVRDPDGILVQRASGR